MPKPAPEQPETQVLPEPGLEKRTRRKFTPEYKLRVIARADACQYGELGALLRTEGLYSGQLQQWRKELATSGETGLGKTKPGPRSALTRDQRRIQQLEKDLSRLQRKLEITQDCVDLQKKPCRCWIGHAMAKLNEGRPRTAPSTSAVDDCLPVAGAEPEYRVRPPETRSRRPAGPDLSA